MTSLSVSSAPTIVVEDVSVTYKTTFERKPTLKSMVRRMGRGERVVREIEAVKHVSFEVPNGTVLGIVGANGAGKSTLVRAIAGILPPTRAGSTSSAASARCSRSGSASTRTCPGATTSRLGGLAAGLERGKLEEKYEDIVKFAELGEFMDMPMRTYSSGMYGRLAFSVAVNMDPDILLIDEALSVGDARFRRKSANKMRELCSQAHTIVLVSHALGSVRELCDQAIWLDNGVMRMWDEPDAVIDAYTEFLEVGQDAVTLEDV